jgi:hypothetical protein
MPAPTLQTFGIAGVIDKDATHGLRGNGVEMSPVEILGLGLVHKLDIGLVNQGGGLQGVAGALVAKVRGGEGMQLVVDNGQEDIGSARFAFADAEQDLGDVSFCHARPL